MDNQPRCQATVNGFFEAPDGQIAVCVGWNSVARLVECRFDDDNGPCEIAVDEFERTFKRRADLNDFPDARDPALPYTFVLLWDLKTRSALVDELCVVDHDDPGFGIEAHEAMERHGIVLTSDERARIDGARIPPPMF